MQRSFCGNLVVRYVPPTSLFSDTSNFCNWATRCSCILKAKSRNDLAGIFIYTSANWQINVLTCTEYICLCLPCFFACGDSLDFIFFSYLYSARLSLFCARFVYGFGFGLHIRRVRGEGQGGEVQGRVQGQGQVHGQGSGLGWMSGSLCRICPSHHGRILYLARASRLLLFTSSNFKGKRKTKMKAHQ